MICLKLDLPDKVLEKIGPPRSELSRFKISLTCFLSFIIDVCLLLVWEGEGVGVRG